MTVSGCCTFVWEVQVCPLLLLHYACFAAVCTDLAKKSSPDHLFVVCWIKGKGYTCTLDGVHQHNVTSACVGAIFEVCTSSCIYFAVRHKAVQWWLYKYTCTVQLHAKVPVLNLTSAIDVRSLVNLEPIRVARLMLPPYSGACLPLDWVLLPLIQEYNKSVLPAKP